MLARKVFLTAFIILGLGAAASCAHAQDAAGEGMSRPMRAAVKSYVRGDDMEAMDRFMDILTQGEPSERSMANEYINLITHRMNTASGSSVGPISRPAAAASALAPIPGVSAAGPSAREPRIDPAADEPVRPAPDAPPVSAPAPARSDAAPVSDKSVMRKEIRARLHGAVVKALSDLKAIEGVRAVMRDNGEPDALGIPSSLLFQSGIAFQRDVSRILDPVTKLSFALGGAHLVILPEGTVMGDAKVMDMRRTMGLSSHLFNAGIAPPRVRVNLLNTQVDVPKALRDFKGVVIVFIYNQPLNLVVESSLGDDQGPPISLGIFPPAFRPSRGQGAIIEFSVSDPPAGLSSWKFQLRRPESEGADATPLQDVAGATAVFHQIFWNGKRDYFGEALPTGRYECILTATDAKNRQRSLHRWIHILDDGPGAEKAPAQTGAVQLRSAQAPSADLNGLRSPLVSGVRARGVELVSRNGGRAAKRPVVKRPTRGAGKAKAESEDALGAAGPPWEIVFQPGAYQPTYSAQKLLEKVAAVAAARPEEHLRITGHSDERESDGAALTGQRAKMIAGILANRFQINPKRIFVNSVGPGGGAKVDIELVRND